MKTATVYVTILHSVFVFYCSKQRNKIVVSLRCVFMFAFYVLHKVCLDEDMYILILCLWNKV